MRDGYLAFELNNTWSLVPPPPDWKPIDYKRVFKVKENTGGTVQLYKAWYMAKGFHQVHRFDFGKTFSPMVKPTTIRTILSIALTYMWEISKMNINNAFLDGELQEEVFMDQPPRLECHHDPPLVCKLHKALCGLQQAPRAWFDKLHNTLLDLGFVPAKSENRCFFDSKYLYDLSICLS